jgi:hypothetical protein
MSVDDLLTGHLARLDDAVLTAIIASSSSQSAYLAGFRGDEEAAAMSAVTGIISVAAEAALIQRRTGIAL